MVEYFCNGKEMQVEVSELSNAELLPLLCEKVEIRGGCGSTEQLDAEIEELRTEIKRRLSYYRYIEINEMARQKDFKRVIGIKEVAETGHYEDMADLAIIFQHNVVEDHNGTWRWRENKIVGRLTGEPGMQFHTPPEFIGGGVNQMHVGAVNLNGLALLALHGEIPLEEYMKFYMQIGYSLSGYAEVFGQREVTEYQLEYLSPPPDDWDFDNEYYQTAIEYMRLKYKGKVLQL